MPRLLTAAVGTPIVLAAVFGLRGWWFFLFMVLVIDWAAFEYLAIVRPRAPRSPLWLLLIFAPLAAYSLSYALLGGNALLDLRLHLLGGAALLSVGLGALLLWSRVPLDETLPALGILGFGIPYFALPIACTHLIKERDPWLLFLLLAIVWMGDSAAYYVGSRLGRHRLAPVVSPKKT